MTETWEIAIVLPLGVIANQLMKIESDLRLLNMKALRLDDADDGRNSHVLDTRLERIREAVDAIQTLIAAFGADLHPKSTLAEDTRRKHKIRPDRDD